MGNYKHPPFRHGQAVKNDMAHTLRDGLRGQLSVMIYLLDVPGR